MKQSNKVKAPAVFRVAVVLLLAMTLSCYMMGELYAKYYSGSTANSGASVAKFDVVCSSSDNGSSYSMEIGSTETVTYAFTVINNSEVAIQYTIEVENLPDGVTVAGNSGTFSLGSNVSKRHTLTFQATDSASEVTEQKVSVKINAVQVD